MKSRKRFRDVQACSRALRRKEEAERQAAKRNGKALKRFQVNELLIDRALDHPDTVKDMKELMDLGFLPPK